MTLRRAQGRLSSALALDKKQQKGGLWGGAVFSFSFFYFQLSNF
jgi:hypothetical protein